MSRQREELYRNLTCLEWSALCPLSNCQDEFLNIQNPIWAASQKSVHHSSVLCLPIPLLPSLSSCFPLFLFLVQDSGIPFLPYFLPLQFLLPPPFLFHCSAGMELSVWACLASSLTLSYTLSSGLVLKGQILLVSLEEETPLCLWAATT